MDSRTRNAQTNQPKVMFSDVITRQDSCDSATTIVVDTEERGTKVPYRPPKDQPATAWQRLRNALHHTATTSRLRIWKGAQVIASLSRNWWLIELCSWALAAFCMVMIATLLAAWNGRPLPDKFTLGLNPNAYVSVLSAVAKLSLAVPLEEALATQKYLWYTTTGPRRTLLDFERFEVAARRPIGALRLILCMRARSFATLGAVIFLLSLALDPFFQQLLSYPSRPGSENPSTVPRLIQFSNTAAVINANNAYIFTPDITLRTITPTFFRGNETVLSLNTFCASDSCTWPEFETLAVCSTCTDISSYLQHDCLFESGSWRQDFNPEPPRNNATRTKSCGWFFNATSDDPLLMTGYNLDGHGTLLSRHFPYHDTIQNDIFWNGSLLSKDTPQPIADFAAVSSPTFDAVQRNETPQAISCTLRWCVQRVRGSFSQGTYHENVISTFTNDTKVPEPLSCKYNATGKRDWEYDGNITLTPPGSTESYFIEDNTMLSARFSIDSYVPNMLIQPNATAPVVAHYPLPSEIDGGPMTESTYNEMWLQPGEASGVVARLADHMTKSLRNDMRFSKIVHGSGMSVTYVVVEWRFFSFPLAVLVLTIVLLVATIIQTHKKDVWKASDLTTLVHGLSEDAKMALEPARSMQEVREAARRLPVYLTACDDGRRQLDSKCARNVPMSSDDAAVRSALPR